MIRTLIACLLLVAISPGARASDLVLYDGDGDRVGVVVGFSNASDIDVHFPDGYWTRVDSATGQINLGAGEFQFPVDDCVPPTYVAPADDWQFIKNAIFSVNNGVPQLAFATVDWSSERIDPITVESKIQNGECMDVNSPGAALIQVTEIDPATYGIKDLGDDKWGYPLPFSFVVETDQQGDGVFCDGFESCPAPE